MEAIERGMGKGEAVRQGLDVLATALKPLICDPRLDMLLSDCASAERLQRVLLARSTRGCVRQRRLL